MANTAPLTRIFISYSHDSAEHKSFVLHLANRLRADGLDCQLDQYINGFPPEGWQRWMEEQIELADFVLLVCTENYLRRYRGKESKGGLGVNFEGLVISQALYQTYYQNTKFIPVLTEQGRFEDVPLSLKQYSVFRLMADYEALYRVLTAQPAVRVPNVGEKKTLTPAPLPEVEGFKAQDAPPTQPTVESKQADQKPMSDTMKAAWLGAFFVLLAALITGIFSLYSGALNPSPAPTVNQSIKNNSGSNFQAGRDLNLNVPVEKDKQP